jgi:hypothetical protein
MGPIRSNSVPKPQKTERSHEENQERAYIAASRRNDRSLEARVESARRASEIHKKRTGRGLKVTEQDVMNEEMYEEEDDYSHHWRRMAGMSHLYGGDPNLFARATTNIAIQMHMRNVFGQQFFPQMQNGAPFAQNMIDPNMMHMPLPQQQPQQAHFPGFQGQMAQQAPRNGMGSHRHAPYPVPLRRLPQGPPHQQHNRSASIATPQAYSMQHQLQQQPHRAQVPQPPTPIKLEDRRMSLPVSPMYQSPQAQQTQQQSPPLSRRGSSSNVTTPSTYVKQEPQPTPTSEVPPTLIQPSSMGGFGQQSENLFGPLTMELPLNTQQLMKLTPGGDDFPNFKNMANVSPQDQSKYSYNPNGRPRQNMDDAMNQTLAPQADSMQFGLFGMDTPFEQSPQSASFDNMQIPYTLNGSAMQSHDVFFSTGMDFGSDGVGSGNPSGQVTPSTDPFEFLNSDFSADFSELV